MTDRNSRNSRLVSCLVFWALVLIVSSASNVKADVVTVSRAAGFDIRDLKFSKSVLMVDTNYTIGSQEGPGFFLYDRAFKSLFGNGDSLANYVSAHSIPKLNEQGIPVSRSRLLSASEARLDSVFLRIAPKYVLFIHTIDISQRTGPIGFGGTILPASGIPTTTSPVTRPRVSYELEILDAATWITLGSYEVSTSGVQVLAFFEAALTSAIDIGIFETAQHLAHNRPDFEYAPDSVYAPRFLFLVEPLKFLPLTTGVPVLRLSLARQSGKFLALVNYSEFVETYVPPENGGFESAGHKWFRLGSGIRFLSKARGGGVFGEVDLNYVYWRANGQLYSYRFQGAQPYVYAGYNYVGSRMFFSAAAGTGMNLGASRERDNTDEYVVNGSGSTSAPALGSQYPPYGIWGPLVSVDAQLAVGVFF